MRSGLVRFAVLASLASLGPISTTAATLRGRVVLGDRPAAGVSVLAVPYLAGLEAELAEARRTPEGTPLGTATTGADGSFVLTVPARPDVQTWFSVRLQGGGIAPLLLTGPWDSGETQELPELVASAGQPLSGKVVDAAGKPVGSAAVVLLPAAQRGLEGDAEVAPQRALTAPDGTFRLDGASAAGNTLSVEASGLLPVLEKGVRAGALPAAIVLRQGAPLPGAVKTADGKPAAGAVVRVVGQVTTRWVETAKDGSFTVPAASSGPVRVVADAEDAGYIEKTGVILPLAAGTPLVLTLAPPAAVAGRTVDATTGKPVPRTRVAVSTGGTTRATRSGPDGTYSLRGLPPGSARVRADEPRYVSWTHTVTARPGQTTKLDVPLVPGATLSGRVTDEAGKPVARAAGELTHAGERGVQRYMRRFRPGAAPAFRTASDGTFKASRLEPGENQKLEVSHPDFLATTLGGLTLSAGAAKAGVVVVLHRGAAVVGTVKDADGKPIAGADVELALSSSGFGGGRGGRPAPPRMPGEGESHADTTGADGAFTIRGVSAGEHVLTVRRSGYATQHVEPVKVSKDAAPAPIAVVLGPGAEIAGRVAYHSGAGAQGFRVFASSPGTRRPGDALAQDSATDSDGRFVVAGLEPGKSYDIRLLGPAGPVDGKRSVVAPASGLEIAVAGNGRITGHVREADGGNPIADFSVSFESDRGGGMRGGGRFAALAGGAQPLTVHSEEGAFALEDVPAGTWAVAVTASGYQPARTGGVVVEEGVTKEGVEVALSTGLTLKGHVTDATTGQPVANAAVVLAGSGAAPGMGPGGAAGQGDLTTDVDGRFEVDALAAGSYSLRVTHPDYADTTTSAVVKADAPVAEIRMAKGSALAGMVVSETGQGVPGAEVALAEAGAGGPRLGPGGGGSTTVSDAAGMFRFEHLDAGRYTVTATLEARTSAGLDVVLLPGQSREDLVVPLLAGVTIQGTVQGLPDALLSGVNVAANVPGSYAQSTTSGAGGRFELDNVPAGVVTLRGTAVDAAGATRTATAQVTTSLDVPVAQIDLVFPTGYALSGRVTQAGEAAPSATVMASMAGAGRQASAPCDEAGAYRLDGLQEGTYSVTAMAGPGFGGVSTRQSVTVTADTTLDLELPTAALHGTVIDSDSKAPLPDVAVTVAGSGGGPGGPGGPGGGHRAATDSTGRFTLTGIANGTVTLSLSKPDYLAANRTVSVSAEDNDAGTIELTRGAGLPITARDGVLGLPLRGLYVRVLDTSGAPVLGPLLIALDDNGQGEIPSLGPGVYTVLAGASGYAPVRLDGVTVPSSGVTVALTPGGTVQIQSGPKTLASGPATGTILTLAGQPALLAIQNLDGRVTLTEPIVQLFHVAPGTYVLTMSGDGGTASFTVAEGATVTVKLE